MIMIRSVIITIKSVPLTSQPYIKGESKYSQSFKRGFIQNQTIIFISPPPSHRSNPNLANT